MKKIVLSLAGVLAATAFAPEAAAIPAFARQTGMACTACHQQHFPILNSFGRAFKAGGYTMMGAQGKVEGDHLSIPDTLNLSMLIKVRYQDQGGANAAIADGTGIGTADGQWQFADEFVLLSGGRVSENVGVFAEIGLMKHSDGSNNTGVFRMPFVFDVGSVKLSAVPFTTDGAGAQAGYELGSGGTYRPNRWSEQRMDTSAVQYVMARGARQSGADIASTGFAFAAQNDMGYMAYTRWSPNYALAASEVGGGASADMSSNFFRLAVTPSYNDWAFHGGFAVATGRSELLDGVAGAANSGMYDARAHFFDLQAHGKLGGKEVGFYAQYAKAPKVSGTCPTAVGATGVASVGGVSVVAGCNLYNRGGFDKWAWTLGVDYSIIPHTLHIGASYRDGRSGFLDANIAGTAETDKSTTVQAIYDFTQNVAFHAVYSARSGSRYNANATTGLVPAGANETMFMLEAGW